AGNAYTGTIVGGTQDVGTLRYTTAGGPQAHSLMNGGDGGYCASDPTDSNYFYGEYQWMGLHRSTNGGASATFIGFPDYTGAGNANFIAPFILDPNDPNTLLAGGAQLWRSSNIKAATPSWTSIKAVSGTNLSAVAVAQGNSNICWVGHNSGTVYKAVDCTAAAPTWVRVDRNGVGLPFRYNTRLTIDPANSNVVYATF